MLSGWQSGCFFKTHSSKLYRKTTEGNCHSDGKNIMSFQNFDLGTLPFYLHVCGAQGMVENHLHTSGSNNMRLDGPRVVESSWSRLGGSWSPTWTQEGHREYMQQKIITERNWWKDTTYLAKSTKAMWPWYKAGFMAPHLLTLYANLACKGEKVRRRNEHTMKVMSDQSTTSWERIPGLLMITHAYLLSHLYVTHGKHFVCKDHMQHWWS